MKQLVFSLVLVAMPVIALADTLTTATVTQGPATTDFDFSLDIDKYNGSEELQSVEIFVSTRVIDTDLSLTNNSVKSQMFVFSTTLDTFVGSSPISTFHGFVTSPNTLLYTGFVDFAPAETRNYAPIDLTFSGNSGVSTSAGDLAAVTGTGTFNISGRTFAGTSFQGGGGNITVNQSQTAAISAYAVYTYGVAVPEPSTFVLMGLGGLGLIAFAYRRCWSHV